MSLDELKEKIIATALEWRYLDEIEPIPSNKPGEKLRELAFLLDELNESHLITDKS